MSVLSRHSFYLYLHKKGRQMKKIFLIISILSGLFLSSGMGIAKNTMPVTKNASFNINAIDPAPEDNGKKGYFPGARGANELIIYTFELFMNKDEALHELREASHTTPPKTRKVFNLCLELNTLNKKVMRAIKTEHAVARETIERIKQLRHELIDLVE